MADGTVPSRLLRAQDMLVSDSGRFTGMLPVSKLSSRQRTCSCRIATRLWGTGPVRRFPFSKILSASVSED